MPRCRCPLCNESVWDEDYCQTCDGETCCGEKEQEDEDLDGDQQQADEESEAYWDMVSNNYEGKMGF